MGAGADGADTTGEAFAPWFAKVVGMPPHPWQQNLGDDAECRDRLMRIPTGFGKTAGVVMAWLFNRVVRGDTRWPRRLVFCLPMRVLVEQTQRVLVDWMLREPRISGVPVHVLMGGVGAGRWVENVEHPAILLGTQDMLLSRALSRGYASGRAMWPMEFGLLHHDALWIFDEIQLMDVGLATSAQLAAFRRQSMERAGTFRSTHTWWMSATLQPRWLATTDHVVPTEPPLTIPAAGRRGGLFAVTKVLQRDVGGDLAKLAVERHVSGTLTVVVVNRVAKAVEVRDDIVAAFSEGKGAKRKLRNGAPEIELVHSRFRGAERALWVQRFLRRDAPVPAEGRIVVATQVIEAGVDISARTLITEMAPWSSLVQRFGRAARYEGESATVIVVGPVPEGKADAAPYDPIALAAADQALALLGQRAGDASPRSLETFEEDLAATDREFLERLYPYAPLNVLRRRDLDDLFDTHADLSGADLDVSRYIRSGDDRDVTAFWRVLDQAATRGGIRLEYPPRREELCPVPIGDIRAFKGSCYVLDYLDGVWTERDHERLVPGMTVLIDASEGGYSLAQGWTGRPGAVEPVAGPPLVESALERSTENEDAEEVSLAPWKTIATHGRETAEQAKALCAVLGVPQRVADVVVLAARWHDVGKAHDTFQGAIKAAARGGSILGERRDLAKAPAGAWHRPPYADRPGFRHELASTLALFELLRERAPLHEALVGPHRELLEATGSLVANRVDGPSHPLADELAALSAADFDLLCWLVCTHHGKVRAVWTSTPHDQERRHGGIHGVCEGDVLPGLAFVDAAGSPVAMPAVTLSLAAAGMGIDPRFGMSWSERVAHLRARHGPFILTYLEAVLRIADWRASALPTEEPAE